MHLLRLPTAALISCALTLCGAAGAQAIVPDWTPQNTISDVGESVTSSQPQVVLHADYGATAIWMSTVSGDQVLRSAHRAPGGNWLPAEDVGIAYDSMQLSDHALTSAPNGDVTAVWQVYDGFNTLVLTSIRSADTGLWSDPAILSTPGTDSYYPTVHADASSRAWAAWSEKDDDGDPRVRLSSRPADSPSWTTQPFVSPATKGTLYPTLALAPNGDVAVSWADDTVGDKHLYVRVLDHSGPTWSSIEDFLPVCPDPAPQGQAFTADSTLVLAYASCVGADPAAWHVKAATRPAGGSWGTATDLSAGTGLGARVAINASGDIIATWTGIDTGPVYWLGARTFLSGASWGTEEQLTSPVDGAAFGSRPVALPSNAVLWPYVIGDNPAESLPRVQAWLPSSGGSWQAGGPLETGYTGSMPWVAADDEGNAALVWRSYAGAVIGRIGDDSGPRLNSLFIATTAIEDIATSFHVEPADSWSALGTTSWQFGDGDSATGADVDHAYADPGTYTVTVSSADTRGKTTSLTQALTVTAAEVTTTTRPPRPPPRRTTAGAARPPAATAAACLSPRRRSASRPTPRRSPRC